MAARLGSQLLPFSFDRLYAATTAVLCGLALGVGWGRRADAADVFGGGG
jgi:hypothetical protein